jgi:hypothetical protein
MDPSVDYSKFLNQAAKMGIYIMILVTGAMGGGLDQAEVAPEY